VLDEFPVAVDGSVEMAELPEQRALGLGVFEDPGLDGFVFSGCGHGLKRLVEVVRFFVLVAWFGSPLNSTPIVRHCLPNWVSHHWIALGCSSFVWKFRRWNGMSPRQFRKNVVNN